jgi:hypothetical protein
MLRCTADPTLATMELAPEGNVQQAAQRAHNSLALRGLSRPRSSQNKKGSACPPNQDRRGARAARAARARIVALVAIAALGVAGAMSARAELRTHSAPSVLAAGTGDIHVGSGG